MFVGYESLFLSLPDFDILGTFSTLLQGFRSSSSPLSQSSSASFSRLLNFVLNIEMAPPTLRRATPPSYQLPCRKHKASFSIHSLVTARIQDDIDSADRNRHFTSKNGR